MPFDPTKPQPGDVLDADLVRAQLNALKQLIDAASGVTSVVVDNVASGDPGTGAEVLMSITGNELHFSFVIPRGADGAPGSNGSNGADGGPGPQGEQGPPGEVTNAALSAAIAGTALNPAGVAPFTGSFSDPPTEPEMQAYVAWGESLRAALFRTP